MESQENSVKFIRLSSGEDLISQVTEIREENSLSFILHNPMKVNYYTSKQGASLSVSLMQWVFHRICEEQNFMVYATDVLTMGTPSDSMESYYWDTVDHFETYKTKVEKEPIYENDDNLEKEAAEFIEELRALADPNKKRILH